MDKMESNMIRYLSYKFTSCLYMNNYLLNRTIFTILSFEYKIYKTIGNYFTQINGKNKK